VVRPVSKQKGGSGLLVAALLLFVMGGAVLAVKPPPALRKLMLENGVRLGNAAPVKRPADTTHAVSLASSQAPAVTDSAAAVIAASLDSARAMGDSLSPLDGSIRLRNAAMHDARRADGDTTVDGSRPAVMQSAESDAKELLANVKRARDLTRSNQLPGAGLELRTAYQMYRIFLTEHAAAPQTESLRAELQAAMDEALAACHAASDAARAHGGKAFKCEHPAKNGILVGEELPNEPPPQVTVTPAEPTPPAPR
jgi:hypothetical protein